MNLGTLAKSTIFAALCVAIVSCAGTSSPENAETPHRPVERSGGPGNTPASDESKRGQPPVDESKPPAHVDKVEVKASTLQSAPTPEVVKPKVTEVPVPMNFEHKQETKAVAPEPVLESQPKPQAQDQPLSEILGSWKVQSYKCAGRDQAIPEPGVFNFGKNNFSVLGKNVFYYLNEANLSFVVYGRATVKGDQPILEADLRNPPKIDGAWTRVNNAPFTLLGNPKDSRTLESEPEAGIFCAQGEEAVLTLSRF